MINLSIERLGINGEGIGFYKGKPIFINGALPDEQISVDNVEYFGKYYKGQLKQVLKKSKYRCNEKCKLSKYCDGCSLQHCQYNQQLIYKKQLLIESLQKYSSIDTKLVKPLIHSEQQFNYRNQVKLAIKEYDGVLHAGLFAADSNRFIRVDNQCIIHDKRINETIEKCLYLMNRFKMKGFNNKDKKGIRGLVIRYIDKQLSIVIVTGNDKFSDAFKQEILQQTKANVFAQSILTSRNYNNLLSSQIVYFTNQHYIDVSFNNRKFAVSPLSFFQLNTQTAKLMVEYITSKVPDNVTLYEGYCGVGILSLCASDHIKKGYGVEIVKASIDSAKRNAKINHIDHMEYKVGDSGEEFNYISKKEKIDCLLVDPARSGLDNTMIQAIIKSKVKTIIYVSCNMSTLAKNLNDLSKYYQVDSIQPFDMFSNTSLVETVVTLKIKNDKTNK